MTTMEPIKCELCKKEVVVSDKHEPMQSGERDIYFCNYDCALEFAFIDLEITTVYARELPANVKIKRGRLFRE